MPAPQPPSYSPERRQQVLDLIREQYPDLWKMSYEVDMTLVDYMLELTPTARLEACRNFIRLWESGHGPSQSR